jgi:hypothetical protein
MLLKVIRNAIHDYYNSLLMTAEKKSKTTWSIVKNEIGKLKNNNNTHLVFSLGNSFIQLDLADEAFNDYILDVVEKLNIGKVDIYYALLSRNNSSSQDFPDMIIILGTESEIISTSASLKNKSSSRYGGISNRALKFCGKFLGKRLAYIFNKYLTVGKFPDRSKYSVVNPLLEKELTNHDLFPCLPVFKDFWTIDLS